MDDSIAAPHRPKYIYCGDPDTCCGHHEVVAISCAECGQRWPCPTKRSHHPDGWNARVERWANNRLGRGPIGPNGEIDYSRMPYHYAIEHKARSLAKDAGQSWKNLGGVVWNWYRAEARRVLYPPERLEQFRG